MSVYKKITMMFFIAFSVFLVGCSGGGNSSTGSVAVSGAVAKGSVAGALVDIYAADGTTLLVSGIKTDANGNWSSRLPKGIAMPVIAIANGGLYVDEYSGVTTKAGSMQCMFDSNVASNVAISPFSNAMTVTARSMVKSGQAANMGVALTKAKTEYVKMLGFDPLLVLPPSPAQMTGATPQQLKYAAALGGVSKLVDDSYSAIVAGDPTVTPFSLVNALIDDFAADGQFDGLGAAGAAITVGQASSVAAALPGGGGAGALGNAMNQYLNSNNRPAELAGANFTPPVFTPVNIAALVTPAAGGGTTGATATGTLTISGDPMLPASVTFAAPAQVVSMPGMMEQWTWSAPVAGGSLKVDLMRHLGDQVTLEFTTASGWSTWSQPSFANIVIDPVALTITFTNVALPGGSTFLNPVPGQGAPIGTPITTTVTLNGVLGY